MSEGKLMVQCGSHTHTFPLMAIQLLFDVGKDDPPHVLFTEVEAELYFLTPDTFFGQVEHL